MFMEVDACIRLAKNQASQHSRMTTQEESPESLALTEEQWVTGILGWDFFILVPPNAFLFICPPPWGDEVLAYYSPHDSWK